MGSTDDSNLGKVSASRRLAERLRARIAAGDLDAEDRLPSERELASENGIARGTAREAIRQLVESGLVTVEHGRGVFVRGKPRLMRFGQSRYSKLLRQQTGLSPFHAEVEAQGRTPRATCTSIERTTPPPDIATKLGVDPDEASVVRREIWYYADDEPMQVGITYIPWTIAEDSPLGTTDQLGHGDLYARFEDSGHLILRTREEVTARMPTPEETSGLQIPSGVPLLEVIHTGVDQDGRPFEVTQFLMRADFTGLDYTMPVDD